MPVANCDSHNQKHLQRVQWLVGDRTVPQLNDTVLSKDHSDGLSKKLLNLWNQKWGWFWDERSRWELGVCLGVETDTKKVSLGDWGYGSVGSAFFWHSGRSSPSHCVKKATSQHRTDRSRRIKSQKFRIILGYTENQQQQQKRVPSSSVRENAKKLSTKHTNMKCQTRLTHHLSAQSSLLRVSYP